MTHQQPSPARLAHVLWLGGSPCSGKTSVANLLAAQYGVPVYHVDDAFAEHQKRFDPARHPTLCKWTAWPWHDLWNQPAGVLLRENIAGYGEHFLCILEDLMAAEPPTPLLVEGSSLLPDCVAPWLWDRQQAIWFVASEAFQRAHYRCRASWVDGILRQCHEPEQAFANWMDRDAAFARWLAAETRRLGLELLSVDGGRSIARTAAQVAEHLRLTQHSRDAQTQ